MKNSYFLLGILTAQITFMFIGLIKNQYPTDNERLILTINTACYFILKAIENKQKP